MSFRRWFAASVLLALVGNLSAEEDFTQRRLRMVQRFVEGAGVKDPRVLSALRTIPRHAFVPADQVSEAYRDSALPIGHEQTISSPYIVARMTEQLEVKPADRVLEIGTGSGYQAAILSHLAKEVYTIEIVPELGQRAKRTLSGLQRKNVHVRIGDGYRGWREHAPYDKIIVTCSPESIPRPLVEQLAEGGTLVVPLGKRFQQTLYRFVKRDGVLQRERVETTFFVPMTGQAAKDRAIDTGTKAVLVNGGFEARAPGSGDLLGWYYLRGGRIEQDPMAPEGTHVLRLKTHDATACHALQPFGVDGREVRQLRLQFSSRCRDVRTPLVSVQASQAVVEFYDDDRRMVGEGDVPVRAGPAVWRRVDRRIDVPQAARFAVLGVGLFGVSGDIAFDDVQLTTLP